MFFLFALIFLAAPLFAEPLAPASHEDPVFIAKVANPNDYSLFANGGWDGNWFVGYNTCWIKKLPAPPPGEYVRAYIGTKLGRMKLLTKTKSVWHKQPIPGAIYMAIASTPAWTRDRSFLVTATEDIPLEGDGESAVEGTGESQWFWAEIPLRLLNSGGENYLALWSPTPALTTVSSSPVLAAAWGGKDQDTWLSRDINGAPPRTPLPNVGTPISYFQPAMALKLIRNGPPHPIDVQVTGWKPGTADHPKPIIIAGVAGDSIQSVWLEYASNPQSPTWAKVGRSLWKAPYVISLEQAKLPPGRVQLRVAANNIWEERAASAPFAIEVSTTHAGKR